MWGVCLCVGGSGVAVFHQAGARCNDRQVGVTPNRTRAVENPLIRGEGIVRDHRVSTDGTR